MKFNFVIFKVNAIFNLSWRNIMEDFNIRSVREEDFLKIAEIAEKCLPMATERNSIYHIFTKFFKKTSLVVEKADGEAVGFLIGFISQDDPADAYIHLLCVNQSCRGRGLAKGMVQRFLETVTESGCRKVYLITRPQNKTAINFYKGLGFKLDKVGETIEINGLKAVKDYNGLGDHKMVFYKPLE
jgi:ribosomal protein S18 acetylase RimI-like enzyme